MREYLENRSLLPLMAEIIRQKICLFSFCLCFPDYERDCTAGLALPGPLETSLNEDLAGSGYAHPFSPHI